MSGPFDNLTYFQQGQPTTPDSTIVGPGPIGYQCVSASPASGGSGYSLGDILTLIGGVFTAPVVVEVTSLSGSAVVGVSIVSAGAYTILPGNPQPTSTGGNGTNATINTTFQAQSTITESTINYTYSVVPFPGPPPESPLLNQVAPYLVYDIDTYIDEDAGYLLQAIAGPAGTPAQIARVHGGVGIKVVMFRGVRIGANVEIPSFDTQQPNETLAHRFIGGQAAGYLPDGTRILQAIAVYVYFLRVIPQETDPITVGALPFSLDPGSSSIPGSEYPTNIIGPSEGPAGGPTEPLGY